MRTMAPISQIKWMWHSTVCLDPINTCRETEQLGQGLSQDCLMGGHVGWREAKSQVSACSRRTRHMSQGGHRQIFCLLCGNLKCNGFPLEAGTTDHTWATSETLHASVALVTWQGFTSPSQRMLHVYHDKASFIIKQVTQIFGFSVHINLHLQYTAVY